MDGFDASDAICQFIMWNFQRGETLSNLLDLATQIVLRMRSMFITCDEIFKHSETLIQLIGLGYTNSFTDEIHVHNM
jgi:hypothetical protein